MSYMELLRGKEETLLRIIHPNVLLLALLTEHDMLDECTEQAIAAERTNFDRNRRLLDWLKHSPLEAFDGFLQALRTNGQEHVANYIDGAPGKRGGRQYFILRGVGSVKMSYCKVFRIGTVRYNWPMSAHASQAFSIAHCTDSEDLPSYF